MEFFVPTGPGSGITGADIQPTVNSFVALGDVVAVSTIVATLTSQQQLFQERFPDDISFAEFRNNPTVLVGGFNNPMTTELTKNLPFVLMPVMRSTIPARLGSGGCSTHVPTHTIPKTTPSSRVWRSAMETLPS